MFQSNFTWDNMNLNKLSHSAPSGSKLWAVFVRVDYLLTCDMTLLHIHLPPPTRHTIKTTLDLVIGRMDCLVLSTNLHGPTSCTW